MKKILAILCLFLFSCSGPFFGMRVVGPYIRHYDGKLTCAFVKDWRGNRKCMCHISDPNFSINKTFMPTNDTMCVKSFR